ncbi:MAG: glycosyltransferase family 39 protein [Saprospiraceae bacterium]|nr:glycosyltransferase family 39 protein [Saprospiraceae bacterium]MCF8250726.1 glycosyltransferase family 39 protein [Saprospiraceae bacterium]MCF8279783.1 glycosyltransferase family 39 protein [Bacteroidales bacterium]MCF8310512.1 glycosyltransferase family 39 protein [Saprospiraceae bacterium]MCF8440856.1 glycosyltransferase family 39 protein [Saprospiraceae bacterium]
MTGIKELREFVLRPIRTSDCALLFLATAYVAYLTLRAFLIPATIDESFSILYYVPKDIWAILTYDYPEPSANNHILNTLTIKFLTGIFGSNLLSARLGNLLAGALFAGAGVWLVRRLFSHPITRVAGLFVWLANPYLAEFFSIGRGYGMSIGLMAFSICHAFRFFEKQTGKAFLLSLMSAWLAVAASFTLLNFYCCLSAVFFLFLWQNARRNWRWWLAFFSSHLLLLGLTYLPVIRMLGNKEFEKFGVTGFFEDTVRSSIRHFFYGKGLLGAHTVEVASILLSIFLGAAAIIFLVRWATNHFRWTPNLLLNALLPGTVAVNLAMTLLTDAAWLPARSCLFFYPLLVISFYATGQWLVGTAARRYLRPLLLAMALASAIIPIRAFNLSQSREWWFDRDSFVILDYLKNLYIQEARTEPISFDSYWLFSLSLKFHIQSNNGRYAKYVQPEMIWLETPKPTDNYEFFYGETKNFHQFSDRYEMVWVLEPGQRALFRRKQNPGG